VSPPPPNPPPRNPPLKGNVAEVKAPAMVSLCNEDEWRTHLYNQERMLSNQDHIADLVDKLLSTQLKITDYSVKLSANMDMLEDTLRQSSLAMKGFILSIVQIPIMITVIGLASWTFYIGKISETTWLIIMGVVCFKYFADGINALAKIIGFKGLDSLTGPGTGTGPGPGGHGTGSK
jgi:hypothetical protein